MGYGEEDCPRCGTTFNVEETRANFDHHYAGSAEWKWDDLPERLCWNCADEDVLSRWKDGTLVAADGPPPSAEESADMMRRFGLADQRFPNVDWYCDRCNAHLNSQSGFNDYKYTWKCEACGHKNSISRDNIYES